ncbi:MAG: class I SAM-dependent methyltransferase [Caulobacter sp.]|nr:class I SAM-dependent methyltransferase [Caulobacter sp.]
MAVTGELTEQFAHAVLPVTTSEEYSRQEFVKSLKFHLASTVSLGIKAAFQVRAQPQFKQAKGREPETYREVQHAMAGEPYYQFWSALQRNSQEMMWKSAQVPVERQLPSLIDAFKNASGSKGSLTLDPDLEVPRYHRLVDIHCMPGGYHTEFAEEDIANGAVYDRAVYVYVMGRMGPLNSDIGDSTANFVKARFPDLKPRRILDMGCGVGHSTLSYVDAYPDAEVYGIDVGAPMLRYAHARAESLGKPVHYSQQNAEKMNFPDGYFDLIVSHILVHETSHVAIRNIMRETNRLLSPGGVVAHTETPPYRQLEPFDAFMLDWDTRNNNEPFWGASHEIVPADMAEETGFEGAKAFEGLQPSAYESADAQRTKVFQGGDFGGGGAWYIWGVQK